MCDKLGEVEAEKAQLAEEKQEAGRTRREHRYKQACRNYRERAVHGLYGQRFIMVFK